MEDNIKHFLETLVTGPELAEKLGVSRMLINKLKNKGVLELIKIGKHEFYERGPSIIKFREYYKSKYPNFIINKLKIND